MKLDLIALEAEDVFIAGVDDKIGICQGSQSCVSVDNAKHVAVTVGLLQAGEDLKERLLIRRPQGAEVVGRCMA